MGYTTRMKVQELRALLFKLDQDREIMILDGFNGSGFPRDINLGPSEHVISHNDELECADCEEQGNGAVVYVIGYGSY